MSHTIILPIPRPLLTTNQARSRHWRIAYRAKNETELLVRNALALAPIAPRTIPQTVSVTWFAPDARRRDSDALDFTKKAVLDALVKSGVLEDDSHKFVTSSTTAVVIDRDDPRIEIAIADTDSRSTESAPAN